MVGLEVSLVCLILILLPNCSSAVIQLSDTPVTSNSNIDGVNNLGTSSSPDSHAQLIDGNFQAITEVNSSQTKIYEDYVDQLSDVDSSGNPNSLQNFSYLQATDSQDANVTEITNPSPINYQMDLELQFTDVIDFLQSEQVAIKTGAFTSEGVNLSYWTGSSWSFIGELEPTQWNNFTVSIDTSTFTIRLLAINSTNDITADSWLIDSALLVLSGAGQNDVSPTTSSSNVDNSPNYGSLSGDANLGSVDSSYATLSESPKISLYSTSAVTGTSLTIDVGQPYNNRLVTVFVSNESSGVIPPQVTINGINAINIASADNSNGLGSHLELWILTESGLGSSSGSVTINLVGGDASYGLHALVFYNVKDSLAPYDVQIDQTSLAQFEILPSPIDIPEHGLVLFSAANGQYGSYNDANWDTNPTETPDDGKLPEIQLAEVIDSAYPTSAVLAEAYWVSNTSSQVGRQFRAYGSVANNRGTGIIVSFEQAPHRLEHEFQWNNIPSNMQSETLAILTGDFSGEGIQVDYWNGSNWNLLNQQLLPNSWNNITITTYLANDSFTIRIMDRIKVADTNLDNWQIDTMFISYFSSVTNYVMQWEQETTDIDTTREHFELTIYGYSSNSSESFGVQFWNFTGESWSSPASIQISNQLQWYNVSVSTNGLVSNTIIWRYFDIQNVPFDSEQTTLYIDYAGISSYDNPPSFLLTPQNPTFIEGSQGNYLEWKALDEHPGNYTIIVDAVSEQQYGTWDNNQSILLNADELIAGTHTITIFLQDVNGNTIENLQTVTIVDVTNPIFSIVLENQTISEGSNGNFINFTAHDRHPGTYLLFRNDSIVDIGSWSDNTQVTFSIDGLSAGDYIFTYEIYDASGNINETTALIEVVDTTPPEISTSDNITAYEGFSNPDIQITAQDSHAYSYIILQNDTTQVFDALWTNFNNITFSINGLNRGNYNFTVIVYDTSLNYETTTIWVHVIDVTPPSIVDRSGNVTYGQGINGNIIWWDLYDLHPASYILYKDGLILSIGNWTLDTLIFDVDGLIAGDYNYTIVVSDASNNVIQNMVLVDVIAEMDPPVILTYPNATHFYEGTFGHKLKWKAFDEYPSIYRIYINGTLMWADSWRNYQSIQYNLDSLEFGVYNVTIVFQDISQNQIQQSVMVSVSDNIAPEFIQCPSARSIIVGSVNNVISLNAYDKHPNDVQIYRNQSLIYDGFWSDNEPIIINLDGLSLGNYTYVVTLSDTSGNQISSEIIVEVRFIGTQIQNINYDSEIYEGYSGHLSGMWLDENGTAISFGYIGAQLTDTTGTIIKKFSSLVAFGKFDLSIDYSGIKTGEYSLIAVLSMTSYENQTLSFEITILFHQYSVNFDTPSEVISGENLTILIAVSYNDNVSNQLSLSNNGGLSGAASQINVTISYDLHFNNGTKKIMSEQLVTNNNGIVYLVVPGEVTKHLKSIEGITVQIPIKDQTKIFETQLPASQTPQIIISQEVNTSDFRLPLIGNVNTTIFWLLFSILFGVSFAVFLYKFNILQSQKNRGIIDDLRIAKDEIEGLQSVKLVLVINDSGLPIYIKQVQTIGLDPMLLSGITSAISNLLQEIGNQATLGVQVIENDGLSITTSHSKSFNFIIISSQGLPDVMLDQIKMITPHIEKEFHHLNKNGLTARVNPVVMEEIFREHDLKLSLTGYLEIKAEKFSHAELGDDISRKIKAGVELLVDLVNVEERVILSDIIKMFTDAGLTFNFAAKVILTAFRYSILYPIPESGSEFI